MPAAAPSRKRAPSLLKGGHLCPHTMPCICPAGTSSANMQQRYMPIWHACVPILQVCLCPSHTHTRGGASRQPVTCIAMHFVQASAHVQRQAHGIRAGTNGTLSGKHGRATGTCRVAAASRAAAAKQLAAAQTLRGWACLARVRVGDMSCCTATWPRWALPRDLRAEDCGVRPAQGACGWAT
jgi:hypothetical protein